jgi:anti-sigma regulatory factor (Ser/Thr protein kinase)
VVHGNQEHAETKVHIRCRCQPGKEISIVVTDQGKGFDFEKIVGKGIASYPAAEHGRGIQLIEAYMDDVYFAPGGWQACLRKRSPNTVRC